jgi:hypothetical protein
MVLLPMVQATALQVDPAREARCWLALLSGWNGEVARLTSAVAQTL